MADVFHEAGFRWRGLDDVDGGRQTEAAAVSLAGSQRRRRERDGAHPGREGIGGNEVERNNVMRTVSCASLRASTFVIPFCVALLVAFLAHPAAANESRTTFTLKADGSCVIRTESAQPRLTIEQQVRMQE